MRIRYLDYPIPIAEDPMQTLVLVIEQPEALQALITEINLLMLSEASEFLITHEDGSPIPQKEMDFILSPWLIDFNSRRLTSEIMTELSLLVANDEWLAWQSLNADILQFLEKIFLRVPYKLDYKNNIELKELFRLYKVQLSEPASRIEAILDYIALIAMACRVKVLITVAFQDVFSREELASIQACAISYDIQLIMLESHYVTKLENAVYYLYDMDSCWITF